MRQCVRRLTCHYAARHDMMISPRLGGSYLPGLDMDAYDDGDGRRTGGRMRRTAWWCGSAGAARGAAGEGVRALTVRTVQLMSGRSIFDRITYNNKRFPYRKLLLFIRANFINVYRKFYRIVHVKVYRKCVFGLNFIVVSCIR